MFTSTHIKSSNDHSHWRNKSNCIEKRILKQLKRDSSYLTIFAKEIPIKSCISQILFIVMVPVILIFVENIE